MSNENNRNSLKDRLMNRRVAASVLVAIFVMLGLAGPAIAQASSDAVLIMHFDEGSGTIAKDSSGHGNDGTIYGATWVDGKYGKALSFDGVNDYVKVPNSPFWDFGMDDFTVSFWFTKLDTDRGHALSFGSRSDGNNLGFDFDDPDSGGKGVWVYWMGSGIPHVWTDNTYHDGNWHYLSFTRTGNIFKLYIDGDHIAQTTDSTNIKIIGDLYLGSFFGGSRPWFNGVIDEVCIYNRVLTADEIKELYEGKKPSLTLTKSASPSSIQEGETTTISIRVENIGTGDTKAIEVTDTIPTGFKIISGSKSASFDKIKPGDYRTCEYTLKATGSGKFTCDPATATYKDAEGNSYSAASDSVSIQVGGEVPVGADSDGDGWSDEKEREMGTNPYSVDSDGDGLKDPEDPNPTVPEEKKTPGFEAVFAIAGLLAVAYLVRRRK